MIQASQLHQTECPRGTCGSPTLRILRRQALAATMASALTAGCGDVLNPEAQVLAVSELLILAQQPAAPSPSTATFHVFNSKITARSIVHGDEFNTPFLTIEFPTSCLASVDGQALGQGDSVLVTLRPAAGQYGFTLSPLGLTLTNGCGATAKLSFGRYGDLSVADGSSTYLDRAAYAAALDLWRETGPDRWEVVQGSGPSGNDAVEGTVAGNGSYLLAAPR